MFLGVLFGLLFFERASNALVRVLLYLLSGRNSKRGVAGMQLLQGAINSLVGLVLFLVSLPLQALSGLGQWALTVLTWISVAATIFLVYQFSGHVLIAITDMWNGGLGPSAQVLFVWPTAIINYVFKAVIPLWNAGIWLWKKVPAQILVRTVTYNLGLVISAAEAAAAFAEASAESVVAWVGAFVCCDVPDGFCNTNCLDAGTRVLDLIGPMGAIRAVVLFVAEWLKQMCGRLSGPIDFLTYGFMDLNLAEGVHFLLNAGLYTVTHLPALTTARCAALGSVSPVMCVPDFQPVFQMATTGLRSVGTFLDNWLDVTVLIVESSLGYATPNCTAIPDLLANVSFQTQFFGSNATILAGMTETLFARTDGLNVQYFSLAQSWQTSYNPLAFPFAVDLGIGVAAVAHITDLHHASNGDDTMALLGCACADGGGGIVLECGVALYNEQINSTQRIIPVVFELPSTARYLACSKVRLELEALRWPATRNSATVITTAGGTATIGGFQCISKGTCLQADAALWIRPLCAVDEIDPVCVASFKAADCFPYCMALHVRGSADQPMIVYGAQEWTEGVTMLSRDCGLFTLTDPSTATATTDPTATSAGKATVVLPSSAFGIHLQTGSYANCTYNPQVFTMAPRSTAYAAYGSITLETQPFAFAGDLALVAVEGYADAQGQPTYYIEVQRIYGNQANEFTVIPLLQNIPASAPCTTPADCGNVLETCAAASGCLPAIPYSWDATVAAKVPATVTENYAFYVTNPDLSPFTAFGYYCANAARGLEYTNEFQISAISSYGGIRLWRMDPYLYCPLDAASGKRVCTETGTAGGVQIEPLHFTSFDVALCTQEFAVLAIGLDYINENNLALTVMRTTLSNVNPQTLAPYDPTQVTYPVLWVNPLTLAFREGAMWMPEAPSPALTNGQLCPSQRRTPNVGSIAANAAVSLTLLVQLPLNIVVGLPVAIPLLNGLCPAVTGGHYLLQTCGAELFSLDDFFSAVYQANSLFFQGIALIGNALGTGTAQTFVNGFALAAENGPYTPLTPNVVKQLQQLGQTNPFKGLDNLQGVVGTLPGPVQAARSAVIPPLAMAQFGYTLFSRVLVEVVRAASGSITVPNLFWNLFNDALDDFDLLVSSRMRAMCGGTALMAGSGSPSSIMTERWCEAFVQLEAGLLTMVGALTVDVPLFACVCRESAGYNFAAYVLGSCYPNAPDTYKPVLVQLLTAYGDDPSGICPALVAMAQTRFSGALDGMFEALDAGTAQMASAIDFYLEALDQAAGSCDNFQNNPYVLALIPQPVDYFRVCGLTPMCRDKCLSEFTAFEAANTSPPASETVVETVQSPLFAPVTASGSNPSPNPFASAPLALMELPNCTTLCGGATASAYGVTDRCFIAAGEGVGAAEGEMTVAGYCVPIDITAGVRSGGTDALTGFPSDAVLQVGFGWRPDFEGETGNFWSGYKLLAQTETTMYQCQTLLGCTPLYTLSDLGADVTLLSEFALLGNTVVQAAQYEDGDATGLPYSSSVRLYAYTLVSLYGWEGPALSDSNLWPASQYAYVTCALDPYNACPTVMLVPNTQQLADGSAPTLQVCARTALDLIGECAQYTIPANFVYAGGVPPPYSGGGSASRTIMAQNAQVLEGAGSDWTAFLMTGPQAVQWLKVATLSTASGAALGSTSSSLPVPMAITIRRACSLNNCVGCASLSVQALCYTAQQCQLANCIGTLVHMNRPLCAIGMTLQNFMLQNTALLNGAWLVISETMVDVLSASGGVAAPASINWPDDAFYEFVCSAKDTSATAISILVSAIDGAVQSAGQLPLPQAAAQTFNINNNAMALFTLTSESVANLLHQAALGPLYILIATQKTVVCSANSVLSTIGVNSIVIGDAAIENASSIAAGRCMTQYTAENTQGAGTGVPISNVASIATSAVSTLALSVGLETLLHPLDATLTWLQGCVLGLQDVVETLDRTRCAPTATPAPGPPTPHSAAAHPTRAQTSRSAG